MATDSQMYPDQDMSQKVQQLEQLVSQQAEQIQTLSENLSQNKLVGSAVGFAGYAGIEGDGSERNQLLLGLTIDDGRTLSFDYQDDTKTLAVKFSGGQSGDQVLGKIQLS